MTATSVRGNFNSVDASLGTVATTLATNDAGNLIIVDVTYVDAGTISVTGVADSAGNTYTAAGVEVRNATQGYATTRFYAWGIAASASTNTITATYSAGTTFRHIHVAEWHSSNGAWTSDPLDKTASGTGNSTSLSTSSVTPDHDGEIVSILGAAGGGNVSAGGSFTLLQPSGGGASTGMAALVQSTAASIAGAMTAAGSGQWLCSLATFRDVPATPVVAGAATFVGSNAGASADNASVSPTIHASAIAGDAMFLYVTCRNAAMTVGTPSGWSVILNAGHVMLFGKYHSGSESSPTVTVSGGSAGDDVMAEIGVWRNLSLTITGGAVNSANNSSAQNITFPAALTPSRNNSVLFMLTWKQDDWTSIGSVGSMSGVGSVVATAGNDAAQAWHYQIQTTAAASPATFLTVTGGASAVSKAWALAFDQLASIAVTPVDTYPPRVLVSVTNLVIGDSVTLYRAVSGVRFAVRGSSIDGVTDTSFVRTDAEMPFGLPVQYIAVVNGLTEYVTNSVNYVLTGGKVALSDAVTGLAAEVVIMAWPDKQGQRQSSVFQVGGRNVVILGELAGFSSTVDVFVETTSSLDNLNALLAGATEGIIQVRQPGGYDGVDGYLAVITPDERRFSADGSDQRRIVSLSVLEVEPWADSLEARGSTLQDIADNYTGLTLQDLANDYATLLDIALADFS